MWLDGLNWVKMGSKWGLSTANGPGAFLEKRVFDPLLTFFWSQIGPFSRLFGTFEGPKWLKTGSKWAHFTSLCTANNPRSFLQKRVFDQILTHFWSQNGPFSRHFGIFHGPKRVATGSNRAKTTCLRIPSGLGTTVEKIFFFRPGDPAGPTVGPDHAGLAAYLAALRLHPSDHWYGRLGVSLGD